MNFKIFLVIFVGVLIMLFGMFALYALGAHDEQWNSVIIGAVVGVLMAVGFRFMKKKRLQNKQS